jgi:hypothetical protein
LTCHRRERSRFRHFTPPGIVFSYAENAFSLCRKARIERGKREAVMIALAATQDCGQIDARSM